MGSSFSHISHAHSSVQQEFYLKHLHRPETHPDLHPQRTRSITSDGAGKFVDITGSPFGRQPYIEMSRMSGIAMLDSS